MAVAEDTPVRLLEAAGQVFAEKGFAGATVREICQRAGARNLAAVNYYFRDKEQLYQTTLNHAFSCRLRQLPLPQWPEGTPTAVKLRDFIRTVLTRMLEDMSLPWQMQLMMRELANPTEAGKSLVKEFIRPVYELLWDILREVLPADTPPEKLHLTAFSIIGQCFYHRVARHAIALVAGEEEARTYGVDRLADHISAFSLAALGLTAPLKEPVSP